MLKVSCITSSDIGECTAGSHTCHVNADCTNTLGSFDCACRAGYSGDGTVCGSKLCYILQLLSLCHAVCKIELTLYLDVNECVRAEAHNCHSNAVCSDTIGSFECVCQDGYMGDGVNCTSKFNMLSIALLVYKTKS